MENWDIVGNIILLWLSINLIYNIRFDMYYLYNIINYLLKILQLTIFISICKMYICKCAMFICVYLAVIEIKKQLILCENGINFTTPRIKNIDQLIEKINIICFVICTITTIHLFIQLLGHINYIFGHYWKFKYNYVNT
jgi:hypothetical protein